MLDEVSFKNIKIENADGPDVPIMDRDFGMRAKVDTEVIFRDLTEKLCEQIDQAEAVFGCVAWLTSVPVLNALAKKESVGIVVQKEDFLRPDSGGWWQGQLRKSYANINGFERAYDLDCTCYSTSCDPTTEAIRCVGFHNDKKSSAFPRMHNKFLVFCKKHRSREYGNIHWKYMPYAVWTGSFNLTYNATNSLENAVLIRDAKISDAYLNEFGTIFGISEPLDWDDGWIAPEYRIGT